MRSSILRRRPINPQPPTHGEQVDTRAGAIIRRTAEVAGQTADNLARDVHDLAALTPTDDQARLLLTRAMRRLREAQAELQQAADRYRTPHTTHD